MVDSVALIKALGGGWGEAHLPAAPPPAHSQSGTGQ
jgi:outer membrane protein TolC